MKESFSEFQAKFANKWSQYISLHQELDKYRGKEIGEHVREVNKILHEIQDLFAELYPALEFISQNYQLSVLAINEYNKFIDDIKEAGGSTQSPIIEA